MAGGNHPKHPKCPGPGCNRALYKTMTKGKQTKKTDPFAFCRNEKCEYYGLDQSGTQTTAMEGKLETSELSGDTMFTSLANAIGSVHYDDDWP